ncbi:MAG: cysteine desulfurase [Flavobacteriales bacterium]|nr:cysteine desulfurase [Flavobacteriales bacterium]
MNNQSTYFDIEKVRADFPILNTSVNGKPLIYFDNGATSQKPTAVITAINNFYSHQNSNIHRGVHTLSQNATNAFEEARKKVQLFVNAEHNHEIIFTRGTTESINLIAHTFRKQFLKKGDEIIISTMEHHSNIVPWQLVCEENEAVLKVIPINDKGELLIDEYKKLISSKTKLVSITHVSNTLGTINPIEEIIKIAKENGAYTLIDGAQAVPHTKIDVQKLDCDFYVFSGHKMYGPTGIGVLYGKEKILNNLPPYQGGGDMIKTVSFEKTTYNELPHKFEAGTPHIAGGIGLGVAVDYMNNIGIENIEAYEQELLTYATTQIKTINGIRIIGEAQKKAGVLSFLVNNTHPSDIGLIIDKLGVAIRTGHHCTEPLMNRLGIPGTARASFSFYNTKKEIDIFVDAVSKAVKMLA